MALEHMKYGDNFFVDSKYQSLLLTNLFYDSIFQPGITYSERFMTGPGGQIFVYKLTSEEVAVDAPAKDFTHKVVQDTLLQIQLNNSYRVSKKLFGIQDVSVQFSAVAGYAELAVKEIKEAWNKSGLACLITEGIGNTVKGDALTVANVKKAILDVGTYMYKHKKTGKYVLCSPETYQIIIEAAGEKFTPVLNDRMVLSGVVGTWLGYIFINANLFQEKLTHMEYYDYSGTKKTVADEVMKKLNFIMYDPMDLSILTNFNVMRTVQSPDFVGNLIQIEMNSGFRVTEPLGVCIRQTN